MKQEDFDKIRKELIGEIAAFLNHCIKKSGIRIENTLINSSSILIMDNNRENYDALLLGYYNKEQTDKYPNGRIVLHIDAIMDYCDFIGKDFSSVLAKIFFAQIHHLLSFKSKGTVNDLKAESFSRKTCNKLFRQGIIAEEPPIFYINPEDKAMHYQKMLRSVWIEHWTGKKYSEIIAKIENK